MTRKWILALVVVLCLGGLALKWRTAQVNAASLKRCGSTLRALARRAPC